MDSTAQFVSDLNVARFLEKLRVERDPAIQASLRRLLLEETDKCGHSAERIGNVQRRIAEGSRQIALQKALIARLNANGQDARRAESTLRNLVEIQRIFERYREVVLDTIDRDRL